MEIKSLGVINLERNITAFRRAYKNLRRASMYRNGILIYVEDNKEINGSGAENEGADIVEQIASQHVQSYLKEHGKAILTEAADQLKAELAALGIDVEPPEVQL